MNLPDSCAFPPIVFQILLSNGTTADLTWGFPVLIFLRPQEAVDRQAVYTCPVLQLGPLGLPQSMEPLGELFLYVPYLLVLWTQGHGVTICFLWPCRNKLLFHKASKGAQPFAPRGPWSKREGSEGVLRNHANAFFGKVILTFP